VWSPYEEEPCYPLQAPMQGYYEAGPYVAPPPVSDPMKFGPQHLQQPPHFSGVNPPPPASCPPKQKKKKKKKKKTKKVSIFFPFYLNNDSLCTYLFIYLFPMRDSL